MPPDVARATLEAALDASGDAVTFIDTAAPYGMKQLGPSCSSAT